MPPQPASAHPEPEPKETLFNEAQIRRKRVTMATKHQLTGGLRIAAALTATALALTACGQADNLEPDVAPTGDVQPTDDAGNGTDEDAGGDVGAATIRYSWWGSDARHQMHQQLIEAFMAEYPEITVVPDFSDWSGYWDKLATQTAGGDAPDVITQEERYLREYAENGVLANLNDYDIDTSAIEDSLLGSGEFSDGLWGIPTGVNVRVMIADPTFFEEAGVDLPDDTTWTWDEYHDLMVELSQNSPDGHYGVQDFGFIEGDLTVWARQHGQDLWTEDGEVGIDAETMAELWERSLRLIEEGGAPPVSMGLEINTAGPEQSLVGINRGGIVKFWTNQLGSISSAAGRDLQLLRYPGETEFERTGLFQKPAMALSMSANSENPEAAALFIDWMMNSPTAGEIYLSDRGLPANLDVREHILPLLDETQQQSADFIADVSQDIIDAPTTPPQGAGQVAAMLAQINEEVLFGQTTPQEGAERYVQEASSLTG